jgi:hypothetical protein
MAQPFSESPDHDAALVQRAKDGDLEAFQALVERHERQVF